MTEKWDNLWLNANIATLQEEDDFCIIQHAAIAEKNGKIVWLGKEKDLPLPINRLANHIHDTHQHWITPGLIDCHTHLVYAGNRAQEFYMRLQGKSYLEIARAGGGIMSTVKATREATEQSLFYQSAKRLHTLLQEGVTTIEIKSGYGLNLDTELKMLKVAKELGKQFSVTVKTSFLGAHTVPLEYQGYPDEYINYIIEEMLPFIHRQGVVDAVDGFCESIAFTPLQIAKVFEKAKALNLPVKLHAEQLSELGGASLAARYQALSADHLEFVSAPQIEQMAQSNTVAVLLPGAYYYLQEKKVPPVALLQQFKVPIAIATDCNPGTSPILSLLFVMNMACILFRLSPLEALQGVTKHAAAALGLKSVCGTLERGKWADFAIWDVDHPQDLVYQVGYNPCSQRIKCGKIVTN